MAVTQHLPVPGDGPTAVENQNDLWQEWLTPPAGDDAGETTPLVWLDRLDAELPRLIVACREDQVRLDSQWQLMLPKLAGLMPQDVDGVVTARIGVAERRGAADALVRMVRAERCRLRGQQRHPSDESALRSLLDGIAGERFAISRAVSGEMLEMLCSVALDLEITERHMETDVNAAGRSLTELREHVIGAAGLLRSLPYNAVLEPDRGETVAEVVSRYVRSYATLLDTRLVWRGGEPDSSESAAALLWVLQELLCHLQRCTAGNAAVEVAVAHGITLTVSTRSASFERGDADPDWLTRCRLRLQLAGGEIRVTAWPSGSAATVLLPR